MAKRGRDLTWTVCRETTVNYPTVSYREIPVFCIGRVGKIQITIALRWLAVTTVSARSKMQVLDRSPGRAALKGRLPPKLAAPLAKVISWIARGKLAPYFLDFYPP